MNIDTVVLPKDLEPHHVNGRNVVVFDVLRATTTMTAALAAGVSEIRVYPDIQSAAAAANAFGQNRILCGETRCLPPTGFDLGNSPVAFNAAEHRGRIAFMSTTNGTRAILAAVGASAIFAGAVVNAAAVARALVARGSDVTLLCAGTGGGFALEDLIGAGAVLEALQKSSPAAHLRGDPSLLAIRLFDAYRDDLRTLLSRSTGGQNVIGAGLSADIDFAARLNSLDLVGVIESPAAGVTPIVKPAAP